MVLLRQGQSRWILENRFTGWHAMDLEAARHRFLIGGELRTSDGPRQQVYSPILVKSEAGAESRARTPGTELCHLTDVEKILPEATVTVL